MKNMNVKENRPRNAGLFSLGYSKLTDCMFLLSRKNKNIFVRWKNEIRMNFYGKNDLHCSQQLTIYSMRIIKFLSLHVISASLLTIRLFTPSHYSKIVICISFIVITKSTRTVAIDVQKHLYVFNLFSLLFYFFCCFLLFVVLDFLVRFALLSFKKSTFFHSATNNKLILL